MLSKQLKTCPTYDARLFQVLLPSSHNHAIVLDKYIKSCRYACPVQLEFSVVLGIRQVETPDIIHQVFLNIPDDNINIQNTFAGLANL
jgi:hypothetical protein